MPESTMSLDIRANLGVDVDSAINTLIKMGWEKTNDYLDQYKPIFVKMSGRKQCKAIVGRNFVTIYRLAGPQNIERMDSVSTANADALKALATSVAGVGK